MALMYPLDHDPATNPFQLVFSHRVQANPGEAYSRSRWEYWTFEYILKGSGSLDIGGGSWRLHEGDVYILRQDKPHSYAADEENPWEKIFFVLHGWLVGELWKAYGLEECYVVEDAGLLPYFSQMLTLREQGAADMHRQAALLFHKMLTEMAARSGGESSRYSPPVLKAVSFIKRNVEKAVTGDDIADAVHLSPAHLSRLFKSETGMPPYAYLLKERLILARQLLETTPMPVKEIAARLQYADQYYFSNAFKKATGHSPTAFRELRRKP